MQSKLLTNKKYLEKFFSKGLYSGTTRLRKLVQRETSFAKFKSK